MNLSRTFSLLLLAVLAACQSDVLADETSPPPLPERVNVAGTGLTLTLPPGLQQYPIGTTFLSDDGLTTTVAIVGDDASSDVGRALAWQALFPNRPLHIERGNLRARLYRRTRAADGGKWDGWWFEILGKHVNLSVLVSYMGDSITQFDTLRKIFDDIAWNEAEVDARRAFQASTEMAGMHLMPQDIGVLNFSPGDGTVTDTYLTVTALPMLEAPELTPEHCKALLERYFVGEPFEGPHVIAGTDVGGCDAWSASAGDIQRYSAVFVRSDGAAYATMGKGDPLALRAAGLDLRPVP